MTSVATQGKEYRPYKISLGKTQTKQIATTTTKIIQSAIAPNLEGGWVSCDCFAKAHIMLFKNI